MKLKKILAAVLSVAMVATSVVLPQDVGIVSAAGNRATPDTTTGLIAYYGFEDSLANGAKEDAAATMQKGTATYSANGIKGKAFDFSANADTQKLENANTAVKMDVSPTTTAFTVSYWVKSPDAAYTAMFYEGICTYFQFGSGGAGEFPLGRADMGSRDSWDADARMGDHFRRGTGSQTGNWQMVTYTVSDKGIATAYVDGQPISEYKTEDGYPENGEGWFAYTLDEGQTYKNMFTDTWGNGDVGYLGSGDWFSNNYSGLMDEVYIYERSLTAEDVAALYNLGNTPPAVETLSIIEPDKTLGIGETYQLTTSYAPANASVPTITWKSSDAKIASVDVNGLVTAVGDGTATITAETDNGKTASRVITVSSVDVKAESVTPAADKTALLLGETAQITYTYAPENVTNVEEKKKNVTYKSSDENILTVDNAGKVTAVGDGTATVTVTFDGVKGDLVFTVDGDPESEFISGGWVSEGSMSKGFELADDATRNFKLKVRGGEAVWNNVALMISSNQTDGSEKPDEKYGTIRGDNWGWGTEVGNDAANVTWDMGTNNGNLVDVMKNADVDVKVQRKGDKIIYTMKAVNGTTTYDRVATFTHAVEVPTYVSFAADTSLVKVTKGKYYTKTAAKAATCSQKGNKEYWSCAEEADVRYKDADCTEVYTGEEWQTAEDPDNHQPLEKVERVEPSCVSMDDGYEEHYTCPGCHKNFKDEAGTEEITDLSQIAIKPEHTWVVDESKTTATCTQSGTVTRECSVCHRKEEGIQVDKLGHDYGDWVTWPATCTEAGSRTKTCKRTGCTGEGHIVTETIEALGHDYDEGVVTAPTCTEKGYTTKTCSRCDDKKIENETEALGHDYGDWEVIKAAACTETGTRTRTCKRTGCTGEGHAETETIQAKGHTITKVPAKAATTTAPGNIEYYTCGECSKCFSDAEGTKEITLESTVIPVIADQGERASLELSTENVTLYTGKQTNKVDVTANVTGASKTVSWTSSAPKVASVSNGTIRALKKGKAVITVKANGIEKKINVTVKDPTIKVAQGKKSVNKITVKRKKSVKLKVTVSPSKSGMSLVKLSKKDKKYVKVTLKSGKLTIKGLKKGKATIKIKSGKGEKKIKVTVK